MDGLRARGGAGPDLPDGRTCEILRNLPSRDELLATVVGLGRDAQYGDHAQLRRWVLVCRTP